MKLKTTIVYSFNVDDEIEDLDFSIETPKPKGKIKIVEIKKKRKDGSTGLF